MFSITINSDNIVDIITLATKVKSMDVNRATNARDRFYGKISIALGDEVLIQLPPEAREQYWAEAREFENIVPRRRR